MKHSRHKMIEYALNTWEMFALILYTSGDCIYSLSILCNVYTAICGVLLDKTTIENERHIFFATNVSFTTDLNVAIKELKLSIAVVSIKLNV